jgi:hypothetical protein
MTAILKSARPPAPNSAIPTDTEERIRRRAYEIYEQRDRIDGLDLDDWLQAETELMGANQRRKSKAARGAGC